MNELVWFLIGAASYGAVTMVLDWHRRRLLEQSLDEVTEAIMDKVKQVRVERSDNQWKFFEVGTGAFVAAGETIQELRDNCDSNCPDHFVVVVDGEPDALEEIRRQA